MAQEYAQRAVDTFDQDGLSALAKGAKRHLHRQAHRRTLSRWVAVRLARSGDADVRSVGHALSRTLAAEYSRREYRSLAAIDAARADLNASDETIQSWGSEQRIEDLPKCPPRIGRLLFALARTLRPERVVELGTCTGTSAAYQAAALERNDAGVLTTLEADPERIDIARRLLDGLDLGRVSFLEGRFRETLPGVLDQSEPIDMAFIDGHHDEEATIEYFETIVPSLRHGAVVVFDDIDWSAGMARAWRRLRHDDRFEPLFTVDGVGIGLTGETNERTESDDVFL